MSGKTSGQNFGQGQLALRFKNEFLLRSYVRTNATVQANLVRGHGMPDIILEKDHLRTIPLNFGCNWRKCLSNNDLRISITVLILF